MVGAAAGLGAVLPAQHLLELHAQDPGELLPGEAAGLLETDQALREIRRQVPAEAGQGPVRRWPGGRERRAGGAS